jgi:hypothetical protein
MLTSNDIMINFISFLLHDLLDHQQIFFCAFTAACCCNLPPRSIYLLIYLFQLKYEIKKKHLHFGWLDKFGRFFPRDISFVQTLLKANIHFF